MFFIKWWTTPGKVVAVVILLGQYLSTHPTLCSRECHRYLPSHFVQQRVPSVPPIPLCAAESAIVTSHPTLCSRECHRYLPSHFVQQRVPSLPPIPLCAAESAIVTSHPTLCSRECHRYLPSHFVHQFCKYFQMSDIPIKETGKKSPIAMVTRYGI